MYKANVVDFLENVWEIDDAKTKKEAIAIAKDWFDKDKGCVSCFVEHNKEIVYYINR